MNRKSFSVIMAAAVLIAFGSGPAHAHKVNVFAFVDGDMIRSESYFPDGRACVNAKIVVESPEGVTLLEGITDSEGMFSFAIPQKTDLTIVLNAGMGHRNEFTIKASELPDVIAPKEPKKTAEQTNEQTEPEAAEGIDHSHEGVKKVAGHEHGLIPEKKDPDLVVPSECREYLEPLIEEEIESRVARIVAETGWKPDEGISPVVVIGGIGYIIGLMGLWMYYLSRKKSKPSE